MYNLMNRYIDNDAFTVVEKGFKQHNIHFKSHIMQRHGLDYWKSVSIVNKLYFIHHRLLSVSAHENISLQFTYCKSTIFL